MATMGFTDRSVKALTPPPKPKEKRYLEWQKKGLSLLLIVSHTGSKTWHALFYKDGRPRTERLGTYPELSVAKARVKADDFDPKKAIAASEVGTFKKVAEDWIADHVDKKRLRSKYEIVRQLTTYVYPAFGKRKFCDITRLDVNKLLRDIEHKRIRYSVKGKERANKKRKTVGGLAQADAVFATIRSIMGWYSVQDQNYASPIVRGMRRDHRSAVEKSRKRILTDDEIRNVWAACDQLGIYGALVKMLLLTGQRLNTVASMRWSDLSDDGVWTIPNEHREKGHIGSVRLPQQARDVLADIDRIAGSPFVFAGVGKKQKFNSYSQHKAQLFAMLPKDTPHFVLHDLRRTARSLMAKIGVPRDIAERTLGHKQQGVEAVYDRFDYTPQKSDALQKLADHIDLILHPPKGGNIVKMTERPSRRAKAMAKY
ncbi:MAG: tyrosine-type recombinase/integrase [Alphaproteobacteria bacterium]